MKPARGVDPVAERGRWSDHLLLAVCVATGLIFGVSGLQKLFYLEVPAGEFAVWGYPRWLLFAVGAAELVGALALFSSGRRIAGVLILTGIVIAAGYTHLRHLEYVAMWRPLILGGMLGLIYWLSRRQRNG